MRKILKSSFGNINKLKPFSSLRLPTPRISRLFSSHIPEDLETFNKQRLKKSEILKIRNQAKEMIERENLEKEELKERGKMSPEEIMSKVEKTTYRR